MPITDSNYETGRLQVLESCGIVESSAEPDYDRFAAFGAQLFDVPICLISLVGEYEPWMTASHGREGRSIPQARSFCARMLEQDAPLVVLDARADERFSGEPYDPAELRVEFYAGTPLIDDEGVHLGAFCILDTKPRARFSADEALLLTRLGAMVVALMEKHREAKSNRAIGSFANATVVAIVTVDAEGRITFWNTAAETMFGYAAGEAIGRSLELIIPERFRAEHLAGMRRMAAGGVSKLAGKSVEIVGIRRDGREFPIELTLSAWSGAGGREFGAQIQDITARRERERRLQHLAHHDHLTGLLNRTGFRERLEACLSDHGAATLLTIDLDGFKTVNDSFGHPVGDAVLQAIAIRITAAVEGTGTLARVGGDEFVLLLACQEDPLAARETADSLLRMFSEPFRIAGHILQIGISIGVAMAPMHADEVDELLIRSDLALLASKRDGGRRVRFFDAGMYNQLAARRAFKDELRVATEQRQWELFYQPQISLADGSLIGAEALLRWRHPTRGLLAPAVFLPVLETHPLAYEVGTWVIDEACRQLAAWKLAGHAISRISVNIFAAQFGSGDLAHVIGAALERHALHPADLELEITETIALRPDDQILAALQSLWEAGVHIAFDDFGTGFASLATLKQLPVSRLKIDRSFVEDICDGSYSAAIVAAMVSLAERLGLELIAEGIETSEQRDMLIRLGCRAGQGFLLGRPVPGRSAPALRSSAA